MRIKSDLMRAMEACEPEVVHMAETTKNVDEADEMVNLTRDEMIARSKELRLLRIRESQKGAKARMQNKIKSKKFHKIMKKEKLKEQMKEFELLQKHDPEAALRKLEQIEKHRVEERALLRHKNTGTWAKNLQVRAKYDKDVRKELAQQLSISRELTQKHNDDEDGDAEADEQLAAAQEAAATREMEASDPFNPWVKKGLAASSAASADGNDDGGYRKYWNERNEAEKQLKQYLQVEAAEEIAASSPPSKKKKKQQQPKTVSSSKGWLVEDCAADIVVAKKGKRSIVADDTTTADNLDDLFEDAEEELRSKVARKLAQINSDATNAASAGPAIKRASTNRGKSSSGDLSFKVEAKRPNIDEALNASDDDDDEAAAGRLAIEQLKGISNSKAVGTRTDTVANINPDTFMKVKAKHLKTALPDMEGELDESDDDEVERHGLDAKRLTIAEAFEDDDIVADFAEERAEEKRKGETADINLTLPGWGSWAGCGISSTQSKAKKLILKFPKQEERKDENRGHVIIVDEANKKLREHQVSALPFPFTSVADYEASIRAPIGRDFVPVMAHQLLTKPAVTTKLGAIIAPMGKEALVKRAAVPLTKTDRRVARVEAKQAAKKKDTKMGTRSKIR